MLEKLNKVKSILENMLSESLDEEDKVNSKENEDNDGSDKIDLEKELNDSGEEKSNYTKEVIDVINNMIDGKASIEDLEKVIKSNKKK